MIRRRHAAIRDSELLTQIGAETFYDSFAADNDPEDEAAYLSAAFNTERQKIAACLQDVMEVLYNHI